jgi:hypothetical protein
MGNDSVLAASQRRALARLITLPLPRDLYLGGGTAVALHLGHRRSLDLDLFTGERTFDLDRARRLLVEASPRLEVIAQTDATLQLRLCGADVEIVRYRYPLLARPQKMLGVRVASLRDLAAMKLAAIAKRGLRRDFWDLHEILTARAVAPARLLADYRAKFGTAEADTYHVVRSLVWFDDAEREPVMPRGLTATHWRRIREHFESRAGAFAAELGSRPKR